VKIFPIWYDYFDILKLCENEIHFYEAFYKKYVGYTANMPDSSNNWMSGKTRKEELFFTYYGSTV